MGNNLKKLRELKRWTHQKAADELGVSRGQFIKLERGERQLTQRWIERLAQVFEVQPAEILADEAALYVPIVGYVGAGSTATYYSTGDDPADEAPMPPGGTRYTVAVECRGTSLGSMFDRWLVYYDDVHTPPTPNMFRQLCVVGISDGRVLVKKIIPGTKPGLFHLESQTEGIQEDQRVEWAALVKAMTPR